MEGYGVGQVDLPEGPRVQVPLAGKQEEFRVGHDRSQGELDALREDGGAATSSSSASGRWRLSR